MTRQALVADDSTDDDARVRHQPLRLVPRMFWRRWATALVVVPTLVALAGVVPLVALPALALCVLRSVVGLLTGERVGASRGGTRVFVRRAPGAMPLGAARWLGGHNGLELESRRSGPRGVGRLLGVALLGGGVTAVVVALLPIDLVVRATTTTTLLTALLTSELRCSTTPHRLIVPWTSIESARRDGRVLTLRLCPGEPTDAIVLSGRPAVVRDAQIELVDHGVELEAGMPIHPAH